MYGVLDFGACERQRGVEGKSDMREVRNHALGSGGIRRRSITAYSEHGVG